MPVQACTAPGATTYQLHRNAAVAAARAGNWDQALGHVRAGNIDEAEFNQSLEALGVHRPNP